MNPFERETVVNASDGDDIVRIWSAQRTVITRLRKHPKVTEIRSGVTENTEWAQFTLPSDQWNPVGGIKHTRTVTPEQKQASVERLKAAREARGSDRVELATHAGRVG